MFKAGDAVIRMSDIENRINELQQLQEYLAGGEETSEYILAAMELCQLCEIRDHIKRLPGNSWPHGLLIHEHQYDTVWFDGEYYLVL